MAKKKAPPATSKKATQAKKQQLIDDKTFGLKNKNKSKKVQQLVQSVARNVHNSGDPKVKKMEEQRKKLRADAKMKKKAVKDEQDALFGEALLAVSKKSTSHKDGKVEAQGRDGNEDTKKSGTSRAMKMMYQMDAQEMEDKLREDPNYVPTLEDEIEAKRQKLVTQLKESGKGTKVTPESFAIWQDAKRQKRQAEAKKVVEAEFRKKKGGKGLGVLSGRALYEYKRDLFKDQEDDGDAAPAANGEKEVEQVAEKVQSDLFLEGDDDDLDDLSD